MHQYFCKFNRFSTLGDLQARVEATIFEKGNTFTAMAMNKALETFKQKQREDKTAARVIIDGLVFKSFH